MSNRPFYTALGFVVWKAGKFTAKHKIKQVFGGPEALVLAVVLAGVIAGGAAVATSELTED